MPRVIYANLIWFGVVLFATVSASISRHQSEIWDKMPEVRLEYDLLFIGVFGSLYIVSLIGVLKRKKWGYAFTMGFNYVLSFLAFTPVISIIIASLMLNIPLSGILEINWFTQIENIIVSAISIIFVILMNKEHVKATFN